MVLMVLRSSLFTSFNMTAVHSGRACACLAACGCSTVCFFSQLSEMRLFFFFFLCLLSQEGPSDLNFFRVGVLKISLWLLPDV